MELHSSCRSFLSPPGEEKQQMLTLNRRLETYLGRVRLLEEENQLLRHEIQALKSSRQGVSVHRKGLEDQMRRARLEVEAAWRERDLVELEVGSLGEELQELSLQRQKEADAREKAKRRLAESKNEMEEERRAQIWLREKMRQLEKELQFQIQTHQEDVAHLQTTLALARPVMPPPPAHAVAQLPGLLDLGVEYSQRATRAWQDASEAYQSQVARLEESLTQARTRLAQVGQEKNESHLKLQALERELASAQDIRQYLEKSVVQQGDRQSQEIQQLQAHLEALEVEKGELGQQIDALLKDSRGLLQLKLSLGLEVATYRALLDNESLEGDISAHQPRSAYITDLAPSARGVKQRFQSQLSSSCMNRALPSIHGTSPRSKTKIISTTSSWTQKHTTLSETPTSSLKAEEEQVDFSRPADWSTPYPKVLQGSVDHFRPQEVHEQVNYAEPFSPPNEEEVDVGLWVGSDQKKLRGDREEVENLSILSAGLPETEPVVESVCDQMKSSLFGQPVFIDEAEEHYSSESETEALIEPTLETSTSSPASESQVEESMFNLQDDEARSMGIAEASNEGNESWRNGEQLEDKIYPDGDEMDTWDEVIESKVPMKNVEEDESETMEEDMSAREPEKEERKIKNEVSPIPPHDSHMAFELMDTEQDAEEREKTAPEVSLNTSDKDEGNDEEAEDSLNGSWRTELGSDSYAQDNTLADTRPLIRYKSDETDANTQASHMDESESSDGDDVRKVGEVGTGTWGGCKSKQFGTMEDLCEETVGESLDEEYNMGSTQSASQDREYVTLDDDDHARDQNIWRGEEEQSDEETEELTEHRERIVHSSESETSFDRMVEQELESLSISTYSARFQQSQNAVEEAIGAEQTEPTKTNTHDMLGLEQIDTEITSPVHSMILNEPYEYQPSKETSEEVTQIGNVFSEEQDIEDVPEKDKEDEQSLSILTYVDLTKRDHSILSDLNSQSGDINNSDGSDDEEESSNASQCSQPMTRVKSAYRDDLVDVAVPLKSLENLSEKPLSGFQEHPVECYDRHADHEHFQTDEWEVLEGPSKHLESDSSSVGHSMYDSRLEPSQSFVQDQRSIHPELEAQEVEDINVVQPSESPDTMPEESNIFQLENSDDLPTTKSKDLHGFYSSGVHNEFWTSALDTGATYQPVESYDNITGEESNQNLAFGDNIAWGALGSLQVANGNTEMEIDTAKATIYDEEEEQGPAQPKKQLSRRAVVEGQGVHSEESGDDGDSWSSGEE